jgi:hypothetical protein
MTRALSNCGEVTRISFPAVSHTTHGISDDDFVNEVLVEESFVLHRQLLPARIGLSTTLFSLVLPGSTRITRDQNGTELSERQRSLAGTAFVFFSPKVFPAMTDQCIM